MTQNVLDFIVYRRYYYLEKTDGGVMPKGVPRPDYNRQLHIKLTAALHKRIRVQAARLDVSIQDFALSALESALRGKK